MVYIVVALHGFGSIGVWSNQSHLLALAQWEGPCHAKYKIIIKNTVSISGIATPTSLASFSCLPAGWTGNEMCGMRFHSEINEVMRSHSGMKSHSEAIWNEAIKVHVCG